MSVAPSLRGGPLRRLAEAQLAVDESWAVSQRDGRVDRDRMVGAGLVLMLAWCAGTVGGVLGGGAIGDPADYGLDAMFPALFLALLVGQLSGPAARVAAFSGGLVALALTPLVPAGLPIVAATAGAAIALAVRR
jgi:predicted branched-subunit amino acid permease